MLRYVAAFLSIGILTACGGDSRGAWSAPDDTEAPEIPTQLTTRSGDGAASLGWNAPAEGSAPTSYVVEFTPAAASATITRDGTHALIRGLANGTRYTFSVKAKNSEGESAAATVLVTPSAAPTDLDDLDALTELAQSDPNSSNGIRDAAVLNIAGKLWMAYSSVDYREQSGRRVQDVSTSLAYSNDGGATFEFFKTVSSESKNTVITPTTVNPCNNISCSGRWAYEFPFLVNDASDPDTSKRFKLFAHKYFLNPAIDASTFPEVGAIVMWTAPSPDGTWSNERVVLGWNATPSQLTTTNNANSLHSALAECRFLSEGGATLYRGELDFVFACNNGLVQKIVMLRSSDHANTFDYVGTPLEAADAADFDAEYFSAPALIPSESNAPLLIATPVVARTVSVEGNPATNNFHSGCIVFPLADEETARLFRSGDTPLSILRIGFQTNRVNGGCAWDIGLGSGILMNAGDLAPSVPQFEILQTRRNF